MIQLFLDNHVIIIGFVMATYALKVFSDNAFKAKVTADDWFSVLVMSKVRSRTLRRHPELRQVFLKTSDDISQVVETSEGFERRFK